MATTIHTAYNMVKVNVSGTYDASATSIDLDTGEQAKCPTPPYWMMWWDATNYSNPFDDPNWEIVEVTAHNASDNITVVRGQQTSLGGKAASTKNTGGASYKMSNEWTAYDIERLRVRSAFLAHLDGSNQTLSSPPEKINFDTEEYDLEGDYDATTNYRFTAPRAMLVRATVQLTFDSIADAKHVLAYIYKGGTSYAYAWNQSGKAQDLSVVVTRPILLAASDYLEAWGNCDDTSPAVLGDQKASFFSVEEILPQ